MLVVAILGFLFLTLLARAQQVTSMPRLVLAVGAPFTAVGALCVAVFAVWRRRTVLTVSAVLLVALALAIQMSWYYLGRPQAIDDSVEIRVLAANIRKGGADAASFVGLARANADVITIAELTPESVDRFGIAGMWEGFPYAHLIAAPGAGGIGIWSRYPVKALSVSRHRGVLMPAVRLQVPGVRSTVVLGSVHVYSPVAGNENTVNQWRYGMAGANAQLDDFAAAAGSGSVIVGGDYNSTPDARQFRDLLTHGYADAVVQTGSGFAPTFPSDTWFPPVITIDHILTRNAAATAVRTVDIDGSDHRGLLASVRVSLERSRQ